MGDNNTDKNLNIPKQQSFIKQGKVNFNPKKFNQLLEDNGIRLRHYKTAICPNSRDINAESHDINCTLCDNGVIFHSSQDFVGIFTTAKLDKIFKVEGKWISGSAMLTAPSSIRFDYFDAVDVIDGISTHSELIKKSDNNIDKTRYKMKKILFLKDADGVEYACNTDFEISMDGYIKWARDNRPQIGKVFTIAYEYTPRYRVIEHMHSIRNMLLDDKLDERVPENLPQQVLVRIDYLVDNSNDENVKEL